NRSPDGACATRQPLDSRICCKRSRVARSSSTMTIFLPLSWLFLPLSTAGFPAAAPERCHPLGTALVAQQDLDPLLCCIEHASPGARQPYPFLERCQRLLERQVAALESLDDGAQLSEHL